MTEVPLILAGMTPELSRAELDIIAWPGELQINVRADVPHILHHTGIDEPTGTWTGGGCPQHGRDVGTDASLYDLGEMHRQSAGLCDMTWFPEPAAAIAYQWLIRDWHADGGRQPHQHPFEWWQERVKVAWSYIWAANYRYITEIIEQPARSKGGTGLLIASFEHNSSDHGLEQPHIHNLMPMRRETAVSD